MLYNVIWCSMMFYDVLWCSMMFYDVLCLKRILGFLLSERTSGVSLVIILFILAKNYWLTICARWPALSAVGISHSLCSRSSLRTRQSAPRCVKTMPRFQHLDVLSLRGPKVRFWESVSCTMRTLPTTLLTANSFPAHLTSLAAQLITQQRAHVRLSGANLSLTLLLFFTLTWAGWIWFLQCYREGECVQRGHVQETTESVRKTFFIFYWIL